MEEDGRWVMEERKKMERNERESERWEAGNLREGWWKGKAGIGGEPYGREIGEVKT